jgi:hypothetical protein
MCLPATHEESAHRARQTLAFINELSKFGTYKVQEADYLPVLCFAAELPDDEAYQDIRDALRLQIWKEDPRTQDVQPKGHRLAQDCGLVPRKKECHGSEKMRLFLQSMRVRDRDVEDRREIVQLLERRAKYVLDLSNVFVCVCTEENVTDVESSTLHTYVAVCLCMYLYICT